MKSSDGFWCRDCDSLWPAGYFQHVDRSSHGRVCLTWIAYIEAYVVHDIKTTSTVKPETVFIQSFFHCSIQSRPLWIRSHQTRKYAEKEKTRPEPEKTSQMKIDYALMDTWKVREHMREQHITRWGLPIIRGSYLSQSRWEQFIAQFHADMHEQHLQFKTIRCSRTLWTFLL